MKQCVPASRLPLEVHDLLTSVGNLHGGVLHREQDATEVVSLNLQEVAVGLPCSDGGTSLPGCQQGELAKVISLMERAYHPLAL